MLLVLLGAGFGLVLLLRQPSWGLVAMAGLSFTLPLTIGTGTEVSLTAPVLLIPAVALGNAMAIIFAGLLNEVGKRWPRTTGNGQMLRTSDNSILSEEKRKPTDLMMMGIGLLLAGTFFVVGQFISLLIPGIHTFAWMILVVAVFKAAKVLPDKLEESAYQYSKRFGKTFWFYYFFIRGQKTF